MAKGLENFRRGTLQLPSKLAPGDPVSKEASGFLVRTDERGSEQGLSPSSTQVRQGDRRRKAEGEQKQRIQNQRQLEGVRLAENESELARRRLLTRQGGRRQLTGGSSTGGGRLSTGNRQTLTAR